MDIQTKLIRLDRDRSAPGSFIDAEFVMHIVFSGSFTFQYQEEVYSVKGHDIILIPPNTLHTLVELSGIDMLVIHFYDRSHYLLTQHVPCIVSLTMDEIQPILELAMMLKKQWHSEDPFIKLACDGIVQAILGHYLHFATTRRRRHEVSDSFKNWEAVKEAVEYIAAAYMNTELSVADIGRRVGLSYNYFCTLFHRYTNETPLAYITKVRLENSKRMLFNERRNVSEAAAASGFQSVQAFSKTFKKVEGKTPTQWLKEQRN